MHNGVLYNLEFIRAGNDLCLTIIVYFLFQGS
jgi:hypothetical protein